MNRENIGSLIGKAAAIYFAFEVINQLLTIEKDTINYELWYRGRLVYHGICFEDRLDARLYEHQYSGKVFDECIFGEPTTQDRAKHIEQKRIRKDRPRYNVQHNF